MNYSIEMTQHKKSNERARLLTATVKPRTYADIFLSKPAMIAYLLASAALITYAAIDSDFPNFCYDPQGSISCPRHATRNCFTEARGTNFTLFDDYCVNGTLVNAGFSGNASSQFESCLKNNCSASGDILLLILGIFFLMPPCFRCLACIICGQVHNNTENDDLEQDQSLRQSTQ